MGKKNKFIDPRERMSTEERELQREKKNLQNEHYQNDGDSLVCGLLGGGLSLLRMFVGGRTPPGTCK